MTNDLRLRKVLDHGFVRLVDVMGSDLSIVRAARVSHDADWRAGIEEDKDARLINYLWKHRHTTPFEAPTMTFEVKAPIFVFRQWHRHRTQSYNEVSARYTELPGEFYIPKPEHIGNQSSSHKQAREIGTMAADSHLMYERLEQVRFYKEMCEDQIKAYQGFLKDGWPRELARMCLPLSTYSRMFTTMNLRNLFHFLELRLHPHAQYEIRVYAEAMKDLILPHFPIAVTAFDGGFDEIKG